MTNWAYHINTNQRKEEHLPKGDLKIINMVSKGLP